MQKKDENLIEKGCTTPFHGKAVAVERRSNGGIAVNVGGMWGDGRRVGLCYFVAWAYVSCIVSRLQNRASRRQMLIARIECVE